MLGSHLHQTVNIGNVREANDRFRTVRDETFSSVNYEGSHINARQRLLIDSTAHLAGHSTRQYGCARWRRASSANIISVNFLRCLL